MSRFGERRFPDDVWIFYRGRIYPMLDLMVEFGVRFSGMSTMWISSINSMDSDIANLHSLSEILLLTHS